MPNLTEFSRDEPSITRDLALPSWEQSCKLSWPPATTPTSVLISEAVSSVHDRRRYSAEWSAALAEETAARKLEEQQRITEEQQRSAQAKHEYEKSLPR
jgi:hypothetical protein